MSGGDDAILCDDMRCKDLAGIFLLIEAGFLNHFGHAGWKQMVDWKCRSRTGANLRRGNLERPANEIQNPKRRWGWRSRLAGARNDNELQQARQFIGLAPFRQRRHMVGADEIEQFTFW